MSSGFVLTQNRASSKFTQAHILLDGLGLSTTDKLYHVYSHTGPLNNHVVDTNQIYKNPDVYLNP